MALADDLWLRVDAALIQAAAVRKPFRSLIASLRKRFPDLPQNYFSEEACELRQEWLTATQLSTFNPGHFRSEPRQMAGPLLACEYNGDTYMLDGTNRLNVWLRDGDVEMHETIIVKKRDDGDG